MKISALTAIFAGPVALATSSADVPTAPPSAFSLPLVTFDRPAFFAPEIRPLEIGMARDAVLVQMGEPSAQLEPNVWLYAQFHAGNVPGSRLDDALIVVFRLGRVSLLRLAKREALRAALARQGIALSIELAAP